MKSAIRKDVKARLKTLTQQYVDDNSEIVVSKLVQLADFQSCTAFSVYLSMAGEVSTKPLLAAGFSAEKRIFIPKILGKRPEDMFMLEVGVGAVEAFSKNSWGIPEPSVEVVEAAEDGTFAGVIDFVVVPGVAFDSRCGRIGHGCANPPLQVVLHM
jgi:5-formyltetrahydrofolate cyclo-ligase